MKKFFYFLTAAATMFAASCAKDNSGTDIETETLVEFNLGVEGNAATRIIGDGAGVTKLYYYIFDAAGNRLGAYDYEGTFVSITPKIKLAKNQEYTVVFWAQKETDAYAINKTDNGVSVSVNYTNANDEARDAFIADTTFTVTGSAQIDVILTRPFAQMNVGVTAVDYQAAVNSGVEISHSYAKISGVYNTLNLVTGGVEGDPVVAEFALAARPDETLNVDINGNATIEDEEKFVYLSMNYVLVKDKKNVSAEYYFTNGEEATAETYKRINFESGLNVVPIERNYRTNIIGQILTGNLDFNIEIDTEFQGDNNVELTATPATEDELALALANVDKIGGSITLAADITLTKEWTPVGSETAPWSGVFDGNGHTISNLTITNTDNAALFAHVGENAEIRNVTLENVNINSDKYAAGLVCNAGDGLVVEDVTVSGNIEAGSYAAGIICFNSNGAAMIITDCENNANVSANRAAGIVAWIDVNSTIENVVNNGNITGSISAAGIANRFVGTIKNAANNGEISGAGTEPAAGVVGILTGAATFEYCFNYGNVKSTADNPNASAAGILGQTPSGAATLRYCANYGDITAEQSYAAGIAYSLYGNINASYCYNSGAVYGADAAGAIAPKAQFGNNDTANYCLNAGAITSNGISYQGSNINNSSFYYNNNELLNVSDNAVVNANDALNVLNGGTDNSFFSMENGVITVVE